MELHPPAPQIDPSILPPAGAEAPLAPEEVEGAQAIAFGGFLKARLAYHELRIRRSSGGSEEADQAVDRRTRVANAVAINTSIDQSVIPVFKITKPHTWFEQRRLRQTEQARTDLTALALQKQNLRIRAGSDYDYNGYPIAVTDESGAPVQAIGRDPVRDKTGDVPLFKTVLTGGTSGERKPLWERVPNDIGTSAFPERLRRERNTRGQRVAQQRVHSEFLAADEQSKKAAEYIKTGAHGTDAYSTRQTAKAERKHEKAQAHDAKAQRIAEAIAAKRKRKASRRQG
jgi:hypothetical protein